MPEAFAERTHDAMKDVLMHPESAGPAIHYYMIRGGSDKTNVTVWEAGTVGEEYIKAYGHYHVDDTTETYTVLAGTGILLLQMRKKNAQGEYIDDEIEWVKAIALKEGDSVPIPPFAGHLMVNTGKTWLVTSDNSPLYPDKGDSASTPMHADYQPIKKLHGFAYYVTEQDGKPAFVKNSLYKSVPEILVN